MLSDQATGAYLEWIGLAATMTADQAGLRELRRTHQLAVPFENPSIHLLEPISLDEDDLIGKIVTRRRGGFCYELNGAFALGAQIINPLFPLSEARAVPAAASARCCRCRAPRDSSNGPLPSLGVLRWSVAVVPGPARTAAPAPLLSFPPMIRHAGALPHPGGCPRRQRRFRPGYRLARRLRTTSALLADTADGDVQVSKDGAPEYQIEHATGRSPTSRQPAGGSRPRRIRTFGLPRSAR
jgi:hypothetical protein